MDKDDALFFGSMCSCIAFIGYIICICKRESVSNDVYLAFSIFSLLVEIGWLILIIIVYIRKYKKSKEINKNYYKTKEYIYDTLNKAND